ncbi:glutaredoxin family protein [Hydrogenophaga luteola]|uniref:Glutaredoxin family protein n=1 Tax=Hydrogenophaga luteola TaxID=1591122 RepID=A0ABV7W9G2_9BURK
MSRPNISVAQLAAAALISALIAPLASAQGVYRIVGPDGKVTYSDQPPPAATNARPVGAAASSAGSSTPTLPTEVRQAAGRYPVTLYSGADCAPCDSGRNFLSARGIPFAEKTVNSSDDVAAFKRLSGATSLPLLTIGGQQLKGYSATEWGQYLDAAGYPKKSTLPPSYRREAATPLVEAKPAAAPAAPAARTPAGQSAADTPAEVPVTPPASNPSGIRF